MEGTPTVFTLQPSSRSRMYPQRAALKGHIIAPYNSPASSTISSQFGCDRKQRHTRFARRGAAARRQAETMLQTYDSVVRKGSSSSHLTTDVSSTSTSSQFNRVTGWDRKQRRVRFADSEASAESISRMQTVPWTRDSVIQDASSSSRLTAEISSTSGPATHCSTEREICQTVARPVVVQIGTANNRDYRIAVKYSEKSSTETAYILGYQFVKECRICLKPYLLKSVAVRSEDLPEIPPAPNSTLDSNFIYKEIALPQMCVHCPLLSPKCRGFCKAMSWIMTVGGLASYVYMLLLFFSSNVEFVKQRPLFPLVTLVSNVCLAVALFCNCML